MRFPLKLLLALIAFPAIAFAQHESTLDATLDSESKIVHVTQQVIFFNDSPDTLNSIVLNDWNNAYSAKDTPLAKRFSDEFTRSFHLSKLEERGHTSIFSVTDMSGGNLDWFRPAQHPDLVEVKINGIRPGEKAVLNFTYDVKLPSDKFTRYGYDKNGGFHLKDCFLMPARYENHDFIRNSNNNLDDIANGITAWQITLTTPNLLKVSSDIEVNKTEDNQGVTTHVFKKETRNDFSIYIEPQVNFLRFSNSVVTVYNSIGSKRVDDIKKAVIVDQVVRYVAEKLGGYPNANITVSESDYERNPFYGLSQLPSFLNVFDDDFVYELKFLKTYTNNYLHNTLNLDPRKDNWVYDAMQIWLMIDYMQQFHPDVKMTGKLNRYRLLKSYNLMNQPFNGQYSYFYMLMVRKNLDQAVGAPKNEQIKFNLQIASKYRAG
ncbi:MAG: aminopeptidase, partial [Flavobacterium sp.]